MSCLPLQCTRTYSPDLLQYHTTSLGKENSNLHVLHCSRKLDTACKRLSEDTQTQAYCDGLLVAKVLAWANGQIPVMLTAQNIGNGTGLQHGKA